MGLPLLSEEITGMTKTAEDTAALVKVATYSSYTASLMHLLDTALDQADLVLKNVQEAVEKADKNEALDPDDSLSDRLFKVQQVLREAVESIDKRLQKLTADFFCQVLRRVRMKLVELHTKIGETRTFIMEYDADCAPVHGPYSNIDDLLKALDRG